MIAEFDGLGGAGDGLKFVCEPEVKVKEKKRVAATVVSVMNIAGFGCLVVAAFMWNSIAGFIALGLVLICVSNRVWVDVK